MSRTTKPLTNTEVKNAKPSAKERNLADGDGLALRIKPNGTRLWVFNYTKPHTKNRANMSFGTYPDVSLAQAREKRRNARSILQSGNDPKVERDNERLKNETSHSNTFEHIANKWFVIKKSQISDNHANDIWRSFELHLFPIIGNSPLHKLTAPQTIEALKPLSKKGSLETVRRLIQRINEVMTFALNTGQLEHNPLAGINQAFQAPIKKHMPSISPDELPELMKRINSANVHKTTYNLILWQLHTALRPGEAVQARWKEIDFKKKFWLIPKETMKKKRAHTIPLTKEMLEILSTMKEINPKREFVFASHIKPRQHMNPSTVNMALRRMGYKGELVAHGFRSIASTAMNEHGIDPDIIESALSHLDKNEVRRAYNRAEYIEQRRDAMQWWSTKINQA